MTPDDHIPQAASISFDAATFEIWGALLNGAMLVCVDNCTITDAEKFSSFLVDEKITVLWLTSALFDQLASANNSMFKNIRCLLVGGDVLNVESINRIMNCGKDSPSQVLNGYGPSENTTFTTIFLIPKDFDRNKPIPIGKPISNTTAYILDKYFNMMPIGIPGELYAGGDGLAFGYLNNEELTKEKFITLRLDEKDIKVYKTGDLTRWLPDGNLDYMCRIDHQVKIRGFRIELDAIELCLLNSDSVERCAVIAQQDTQMRKTLVAYVVLKKEKDIASVRRFLDEHLPYYMIPNIFITLDSLPQTPNGKTDKKELLLRFKENPYISDNYIAPRNALEHKLADIWKKLLNINTVGVKDNFFDLGGYSLLMTEMMVEVRKQYNINFSLSSCLETPTIESLSRLMDPQLAEPTKNFDITSQLLNDTFLDPNIKPLPENIDISSEKKQKSILLTGSTGFLGVHLLNDLLRLTDAKIYCLIRGDSLAHAKQKLEQTISRCKLSEMLSNKYGRIIVVLGDLSKPKLGIDEEIFYELSEQIDDIYHCGAHVHHIYNYDLLRKPNVLSTLEIIKFATQRKNKRIHYISALSSITTYADEDFPTENMTSFKSLSGYMQTKLVSEIILHKAQKRGIFVSTYRPTWIIGNTKTEVCTFENNHLFLLLQGCAQIGYAPLLDAKLSMLPVDFVSNFIIKTSLNIDVIKSRIFNMVASHPMSWNNLIKKMQNYGYKIKLVPAMEWRNYLSNINKSNPAFPVMFMYSDGGTSWSEMQNAFLRVNTDNVKMAKEIFGLKCGNIDNIVLKNCATFCYK